MRFQSCFTERRPPVPLGIALLAASAALLVTGAAPAPPAAPQDSDAACSEISHLRGPAQAEVLSLARILALKPAMAIDLSGTTGEYCLNTGGPVMAHFSDRPAETSEDIVYFVDAAPLVAKGLRLREFPAIDPKLGTMKPGTWYRYEGQGTEPHHGRELKDHTWLMVAVDVNQKMSFISPGAAS